MNNTPIVRRLFKGLLTIGILAIIAIAIGMFFAFGGNNPLLIHVANVIDMLLMAVTVLFVMGIIYIIYLFATGNGQTVTRKRSNRKNDEIPELAELIDSLDATNH